MAINHELSPVAPEGKRNGVLVLPRDGRQKLVVAETAGKIYPEISLKEERERQIGNFIKLGFPRFLHMSKEQYADRFPEFTSQPPSFKGRMDTPALIDPAIPIRDKCDLAGIEYQLLGLDVSDWSTGLINRLRKMRPYAAWFDHGKNSLGKKIEDVERSLGHDQASAISTEGIDLFIHGLYQRGPVISKHCSPVFAGTSVSAKGRTGDSLVDKARGKFEARTVAVLILSDGQPALSYAYVDTSSHESGVVVRGRQK